MKKYILIFAIFFCLLAPLIGRSQIRELGDPSNQTKEAISDSLDDIETAHGAMLNAAFPDSFIRAWNDSIPEETARRNAAIKDSLDVAEVAHDFMKRSAIDDTLEAKGVYPDSLAGVPRLEAKYNDWTAAHTRVATDSAHWDDAYVRVKADSANWNTAFTDRLKWDGGATGLTPATGRTSLELGSLATLSAVDSSLMAANSGAIGDIAGLSDRLGEKQESSTAMLKAAFPDSLGNPHTAVYPTFGKVTMNPATADTNKYLQEWLKNGIYKVVMDSSGNLGIGTTAPTNKLSVNGGIFINGAASFISEGLFLSYTGGQSEVVAMRANGASYDEFNIKGRAIEFSVGSAGTIKNMFAENGSVGIGTIVPVSNSLTLGGGASQRDLGITRENVPAFSDSSLKMTISSGYPSIIGYGGDASTSNITWAAGDVINHSGATGGYGFDNPIKMTGKYIKFALNATLPDTTGFTGGETWLSAIGDTTYIYMSNHTIRSQP